MENIKSIEEQIEKETEEIVETAEEVRRKVMNALNSWSIFEIKER